MDYKLANRDKNYQIADLVVPLPTAMKPQHFGQEFLFLSHPGERRVALVPEAANRVESLIESGLSHLLSGEKAKTLTPAHIDFVKTQLPKFALAFYSTDFLFDEVRVENAMDVAVKENIPVVMTVACETTGKEFPKYQCSKGFSRGYQEYLNFLGSKHPAVFAIPTFHSQGIVYGDPCTCMNEAYYFGKSEKGKEVFGQLLEHPWKRISIGGGQISRCLRSSLAYLLDHPLVLVDNFCCPHDLPEGELKKEERKAIMDISLGLLKPDKEAEARKNLTKMLDGLFPPEVRYKEYGNLLGTIRKLRTQIPEVKDKVELIGVGRLK